MRLRQIILEFKMLNNRLFNNPDVLIFSGNPIMAFIYTRQHKLYLGNDRRSYHHDIICQHPEIGKDEIIRPLMNATKIRRGYNLKDHDNLVMAYYLRQVDLHGRIGRIYPGEGESEIKIVSFWSTIPETYDLLLQECLDLLIENTYISPNDYLSTPLHGTIPVGFVMRGNATTKELSPEEREDYKRQEDLHMMRGDQKKAELRKIGYAGSSKQPMQKQAEQIGIVKPGHKWWAPTSESKSV